MEESFTNKYVIEVESGHPGFTNYTVISTISGFEEMLNSLNAQIDRVKRRSDHDPQFRVSRTHLWHDYATLAPGRTSRINLTFEIDGSLDKYHKVPLWRSAAFEYLGLLLIALVLILAGIGVVSIVRFIF